MTTSFVSILADPAWEYKDGLTMAGPDRSAMSQYDTMTTDAVCKLATTPASYPVGRSNQKCPDLRIANYSIARDALLFLWVTNPFLLNGDGARVCRDWGFEPKQLITWVKGRLDYTTSPRGDDGVICHNDVHPKFIPHVGMGHYTRGCTEHIILATRGRAKLLVKSKSVPNVFIAPRQEHSRKPEEQYSLVESLAPGPYLELFARRSRDGWTSWGNQL